SRDLHANDSKALRRRSGAAVAKSEVDLQAKDCHDLQGQPFWASARRDSLVMQPSHERSEEFANTNRDFSRARADDSKARNVPRATNASRDETYRTSYYR